MRVLKLDNGWDARPAVVVVNASDDPWIAFPAFNQILQSRDLHALGRSDIIALESAPGFRHDLEIDDLFLFAVHENHNALFGTPDWYAVCSP
jgi:hypothetical protein